MAERVNRAAVITHKVPSVSEATLKKVVPLLLERRVEILLPPGEDGKHPGVFGGEETICCRSSRKEIGGAALSLVLGGDGTMLRALRYTQGLGVPVLGINLGNVGFFASIAPDRVDEELPPVLDGKYESYSLSGLVGDLDSVRHSAINDIVLLRHQEGGVCHLSYSLNDVEMFRGRADGLVAATPAGSSAYNLAAGGPLVGPRVGGFVVSPIAPHTLQSRPVVAADADVLKIRNESPHEAAAVMVDGAKVGDLNPGEHLKVSMSGEMARVAFREGNSFYGHFRDRFL